MNFLGLAGSFGWSLETDDFEGRYFDQPYPLLRVRYAIFLGRRNSTLIFIINITVAIIMFYYHHVYIYRK